VLCTLLAGRRLEHDHQFSGYAAAVYEAMERSRLWHAAFDRIEHGRIPVVAALHGAVIGGGLELALTAHVRVADRTEFYALPEGRLGTKADRLPAASAVPAAACRFARSGRSRPIM